MGPLVGQLTGHLFDLAQLGDDGMGIQRTADRQGSALGRGREGCELIRTVGVGSEGGWMVPTRTFLLQEGGKFPEAWQRRLTNQGPRLVDPGVFHHNTLSLSSSASDTAGDRGS